MGNYTQVLNMVSIKGIMDYNTILNIVSPPNKDNLPITNMQLAFKIISGDQ
jgi:hypothetical protein